eukprot:CAMPEP_0116999110 /NCGR_PEP_ID=MMETSP0472-20121206/1942_1 /TAXON_ID=693140 ORGANISM="Tiarina fusus, Strain LIS" /NCGR_SAMPLE_ID=MMETSP0472 /ASSEMBLY_ACC=CAM_ASM_000603 /LENGTH=123 /DNA_ID=CAMNT_0004698455 /DNA_START=116 /DNA_END=487 /DNA_ORIENTATION=+
MKTLLSLFLVLLLVTESTSFGVPATDTSTSKATVGRSDFLGIIAGGIALGTVGVPLPAAAGDDAAKSGTKKDPTFEACLSTCMYECTKPKGAEQKSRKECLPECKQSCATTKAQLMTGVPSPN